MFKFLKGKLKSVVGNFSKKTEEEIAEKEQIHEGEGISGPRLQTEALGKEEASREAGEAQDKEEASQPLAEEANFSGKAEEEPSRKEQSEESSGSPERTPIGAETPERAELKDKETGNKSETAQPPPEKSYLTTTIEEVREDLKKKSKEIKEEESKGFFSKIKDAIRKKKTSEEAQTEPEEKLQEAAEGQAQDARPEDAKIPEEAVPEEKEEGVPEKQKTGLFKRVTQAFSTRKISEKKFEEMFEEMELALLENNVALEVVDKIKEDLKASLVGVPLTIGRVESTITKTLKDSISGLFVQESLNLVEMVRQKKPYVIMFVGINGSGKTTTIAKVANLLQENGLKPVVAAADTFRAAAIQQLQEHADRLNVKLVKHDYGADPAAVAFDAIRYAESNNADAVLVDTAGRQHNNKNLMEEVKKIARVANPDLKIFIGESITGNDCVEQAENFNQAVGIDGIILTKADVDEKGGAAISISHVTKKPIIYLGTGQEYSDLKSFNPAIIIDSLELSA